VTPKPKTPSMLCQSEKDVTALPTNPVYVSACRAAFGIAPTPTGLCAGCRAMPHDERLALSLRVVEDTLSQLAAGRDWRLAIRSAPRPCDERTRRRQPRSTAKPLSRPETARRLERAKIGRSDRPQFRLTKQ
jgi:hypothetical protein